MNRREVQKIKERNARFTKAVETVEDYMDSAAEIAFSFGMGGCDSPSVVGIALLLLLEDHRLIAKDES